MASPDDAEAILNIYRPFITDTVVTFEEAAPTINEFRERIKSILEESPYLVCEVDGKIAGYAYASAYRPRASFRWTREVTVYIAGEFQGRNIGIALYAALFSILKAQNYANLLAAITLPNHGSVRLHERMGFKPCGVFNQVGYKMNRWRQVGWWELALIDANEHPGEPILLKDFDDVFFLNQTLQETSNIIEI